MVLSIYLPNRPKSGSTGLYYSKKQKEIPVSVENLSGSLQRIKYYLTHCQSKLYGANPLSSTEELKKMLSEMCIWDGTGEENGERCSLSLGLNEKTTQTGFLLSKGKGTL